MITANKLLPTFVIWICAICAILPGSLSAEQVEILVESTFEPHTAAGLLLSNAKSIQKPNPQVRKYDDSQYLVSFDYEPSELKGDTVATAMIVSSDGKVAFGDVTPILKAGFSPLVLNLPRCAHTETTKVTLQGQYALIESLVNIRSNRLKVLKQGIKKKMSGNLLTRLQNLERGFGLERIRPLSSELPVSELVDRLARLQVAIQNLQSHRPTTPQPNE
ncbi:MAG: hypothetical protein KDD42_00565 [Bdellovibrionales bacterium]|nr:hypothetical protein [Bdellovibrionales bacterium]